MTPMCWSVEHSARFVSALRSAYFLGLLPLSALNLDDIHKTAIFLLWLRFSIVISLVIYKRIRALSASIPLLVASRFGQQTGGKDGIDVIN